MRSQMTKIVNSPDQIEFLRALLPIGQTLIKRANGWIYGSLDETTIIIS